MKSEDERAQTAERMNELEVQGIYEEVGDSREDEELARNEICNGEWAKR